MAVLTTTSVRSTPHPNLVTETIWTLTMATIWECDIAFVGFFTHLQLFREKEIIGPLPALVTPLSHKYTHNVHTHTHSHTTCVHTHACTLTCSTHTHTYTTHTPTHTYTTHTHTYTTHTHTHTHTALTHTHNKHTH